MGLPIRVDIWSDIVCPWCYVGREHLLRALEETGLMQQAEIHHHAFQLSPDFGQSMPLPLWLRGKFGPSHEAIARRVQGAGERVGLSLRFDQGFAANTRAAHRLIKAADAQGKGDAMIERLMRAHFTDGLDIADEAVLERLGRELQISASAIAAAITGDDAFEPAVEADIDAARAIGIRGVPFFVINQRWGLSGAQPVEAFVQALETARDAAEPVEPNAEAAA